MEAIAKDATISFYKYPLVGSDDWRYTFATAKTRALETQLLTRATLVDLANAPDFTSALDLLSSTEYALPAGTKEFAQVEEMLLQRRSELRKLFASLMQDEELVQLLKQRDDFANLRLALRRQLTEKPIGVDYSNHGSIPADEFQLIFEHEDYAPLPEYMQQAIEDAVLAYYADKNIREIDFSLDASQAYYKISMAHQLQSEFLESLFRIQVDILNIKTMLRLKFTESELRDVFVGGGFIEIDRFKHCLDVGYEAIASLFFATPYYEVIDSGVSYLMSHQSFLKLEANTERYISEFLKQTTQITAGPQPVIAYLLLKESEIRTVRLILTARKNNLQTQLILDRIGD
jgi:V/A-type H+-transporting ATPase subunit C